MHRGGQQPRPQLLNINPQLIGLVFEIPAIYNSALCCLYCVLGLNKFSNLLTTVEFFFKKKKKQRFVSCINQLICPLPTKTRVYPRMLVVCRPSQRPQCYRKRLEANSERLDVYVDCYTRDLGIDTPTIPLISKTDRGWLLAGRPISIPGRVRLFLLSFPTSIPALEIHPIFYP